MADWRQIQARIRKAKTAADPSSKLSELYQRTHDAMVAWELGAHEEKGERTESAVKWYTIAAQRFRRADWKKKAEEALTRLGAPLPAAQSEARSADSAERSGNVAEHESEAAEAADAAAPAVGEIIEAEADSTDDAAEDAAQPAPRGVSASASDPARRKRRRGRRGGRGRHRKGAPSPSLPSQAFADSSRSRAQHEPHARTSHAAESESSYEQRRDRDADRAPERRAAETSAASRGSRFEHEVPQLPSERTAHGRAGDPALASRMAQLESMLRRLLSSPLHRADQTDEAPAGPGVFLLSDSDQVTSYYIESCQTLRIGLGNLIRGGRARGNRGSYADVDLKNKLAEHLGINESKVSQYIKDHCVVRWIQLDDDAPHLAHFAIGVLRTPLNLE